MMKNHRRAGLGVVCALALLARVASASIADVTFNFDENGNNTLIINNGVPHPVDSTTAAPGIGLPATLRYNLSFPFVPGFVILQENQDGQGLYETSDLLLFVPGEGLYVYSGSGDRDLADVNGIPNLQLIQDFFPNHKTLLEQGGEGGWNGYLGYVPGVNVERGPDPGFIGPHSTYNFTSDAVPLPGAAWTGLTLLGGVAGVSALRRRFARRHA